MNIKYRIPLLSARAIISYCEDCGNGIYTFVLNAKQTSDTYLIGGACYQDDNAIFFQTMCLLKENFTQPKVGTLINDLYDAIIYIDFNGIFDRSAKHKKYADRQKKAESMFRPEGISLDFGTGAHRYIAFERSGSMSRNARLSFVRSDVYKPLQKRMMLDMVIGNCQLSKLYAYNGLLFSSGKRIDGIEIDEPHRVIVIDNPQHKVENVRVITVVNENGNSETRKYRRVEKEETIESICFDGEGLISKKYADILDRAFCGQHIHTSFQIRMPYIKGMVHQVDFHDFFKNSGVRTIKDMWGEAHPVEAVDIILTKSMFKGCGWLNENRMGWADYWSAFSKYRHALYITGVNKPQPERYTELNYQFLNTASIDCEEFRPVDLPNGWSHSPEEDLRRWITKETETAYYKLCNDNDYRLAYFLDVLKRKDASRNSREYKLAKILKKNPRFIDEPIFCKELDDKAEAILRDYSLGKLIVSGDNRYLSGDLMELLVTVMTDNADVRNRKQNIFFSSFLAHRFTSDAFYAPMAAYNDAEGCTLLRNPHIARNEEIQLKKHDAKDNPRHYYLGHLSGVVMIDAYSAIAERLGGADFDGDMVKTIADPLMNACVRKNYGESDYRHLRESANLPLLKIPAEEPIIRDANDWHARFETVRNTFSSRVGQISNAALDRSIIAYDENLSAEERRRCREETETLAILTGLEIDSAKSGVKPDLSEYLQNKTVRRSIFIKYKNLIEDAEQRREWYEPTHAEKLKKFFSDINWTAVSSNVERLPYLALQLKKATVKRKAKPCDSSLLYAFAADPEWRDKLNPAIMARLNELIADYETALTRIRTSRITIKERKRQGDIERILFSRCQDEEYDSDSLYSLFTEYEPKRIADIRRAITDEQWCFMNEAERERFLYKHVPELERHFDLFSDFRRNGYRILGDIICDIDEENTINSRQALHREHDSSYVKTMLETYITNTHCVDYKDVIARKCRELLSEIIKPTQAVKYAVALNKRNFLWDVLIDEVERYVL